MDSAHGIPLPPLGIDVPHLLACEKSETAHADTTQFHADENFWTCLEVFAQMLPDASAPPTVTVQSTHRYGHMMNVNKSFLQLFRATWQWTFPLLISVCSAYRDGPPCIAAFMAHPELWQEIRKAGERHATLDVLGNPERTPQGWVLVSCKHQGDSPPEGFVPPPPGPPRSAPPQLNNNTGGGGFQEGVLLKQDAWNAIVNKWGGKTPEKPQGPPAVSEAAEEDESVVPSNPPSASAPASVHPPAPSTGSRVNRAAIPADVEQWEYPVDESAMLNTMPNVNCLRKESSLSFEPDGFQSTRTGARTMSEVAPPSSTAAGAIRQRLQSHGAGGDRTPVAPMSLTQPLVNPSSGADRSAICPTILVGSPDASLMGSPARAASVRNLRSHSNSPGLAPATPALQPHSAPQAAAASTTNVGTIRPLVSALAKPRQRSMSPSHSPDVSIVNVGGKSFANMSMHSVGGRRTSHVSIGLPPPQRAGPSVSGGSASVSTMRVKSVLGSVAAAKPSGAKDANASRMRQGSKPTFADPVSVYEADSCGSLDQSRVIESEKFSPYDAIGRPAPPNNSFAGHMLHDGGGSWHGHHHTRPHRSSSPPHNSPAARMSVKASPMLSIQSVKDSLMRMVSQGPLPSAAQQQQQQLQQPHSQPQHGAGSPLESQADESEPAPTPPAEADARYHSRTSSRVTRTHTAPGGVEGLAGDADAGPVCQEHDRCIDPAAQEQALASETAVLMAAQHEARARQAQDLRIMSLQQAMGELYVENQRTQKRLADMELQHASVTGTRQRAPSAQGGRVLPAHPSTAVPSQQATLGFAAQRSSYLPTSSLPSGMPVRAAHAAPAAAVPSLPAPRPAAGVGTMTAPTAAGAAAAGKNASSPSAKATKAVWAPGFDSRRYSSFRDPSRAQQRQPSLLAPGHDIEFERVASARSAQGQGQPVEEALATLPHVASLLQWMNSTGRQQQFVEFASQASASRSDSGAVAAAAAASPVPDAREAEADAPSARVHELLLQILADPRLTAHPVECAVDAPPHPSSSTAPGIVAAAARMPSLLRDASESVATSLPDDIVAAPSPPPQQQQQPPAYTPLTPEDAGIPRPTAPHPRPPSQLDPGSPVNTEDGDPPHTAATTTDPPSEPLPPPSGVVDECQALLQLLQDFKQTVDGPLAPQPSAAVHASASTPASGSATGASHTDRNGHGIGRRVVMDAADCFSPTADHTRAERVDSVASSVLSPGGAAGVERLETAPGVLTSGSMVATEATGGGVRGSRTLIDSCCASEDGPQPPSRGGEEEERGAPPSLSTDDHRQALQNTLQSVEGGVPAPPPPPQQQQPAWRPPPPRPPLDDDIPVFVNFNAGDGLRRVGQRGDSGLSNILPAPAPPGNPVSSRLSQQVFAGSQQPQQAPPTRTGSVTTSAPSYPSQATRKWSGLSGVPAADGVNRMAL